mmetsp:Transcript_13617/g.55135  ORF Transcript_13617/g.55135 Transcript_13617/m.55135 type:complete len:311 (-) Transcript_13617:161-1093(-)
MRTPAPSSRSRRSHRTPPPDARSSSCPRPWTAPSRRGRSTRPAARWRRGRNSRPPTDPRRGGASYPPATETRCTSGRTRATHGPSTRVASPRSTSTAGKTWIDRACRTTPDGCARWRCSQVLGLATTTRRTTRRTSVRTSARTSVAGGASAPRATSCARGASTRLKPDEKKLPEHVLTRLTPVRHPFDTCQTRASLASSPATSSRWRPPPAGCSAASRTEPCGGGAFASGAEPSHPRVGRDPSMLDPSRCPRCDAPTTPRTTRAAVNDERSYHVAVATTPGASPRSSPSGHHLRVGAPPPPPPPRDGGSW